MLNCDVLQVRVFWTRMTQLQEEKTTVQVKVEGSNRRGLIVRFGPYQGIIPIIQLGSVSGREALGKYMFNIYLIRSLSDTPVGLCTTLVPRDSIVSDSNFMVNHLAPRSTSILPQEGRWWAAS